MALVGVLLDKEIRQRRLRSLGGFLGGHMGASRLWLVNLKGIFWLQGLLFSERNKVRVRWEQTLPRSQEAQRSILREMLRSQSQAGCTF